MTDFQLLYKLEQKQIDKDINNPEICDFRREVAKKFYELENKFYNKFPEMNKATINLLIFKLAEIKEVYDSCMNIFGLTFYHAPYNYSIAIDYDYLISYPEYVLKEIVAHEFAHCMNFIHSDLLNNEPEFEEELAHDEQWKLYAEFLGATPKSVLLGPAGYHYLTENGKIETTGLLMHNRIQMNFTSSYSADINKIDKFSASDFLFCERFI